MPNLKLAPVARNRFHAELERIQADLDRFAKIREVYNLRFESETADLEARKADIEDQIYCQACVA